MDLLDFVVTFFFFLISVLAFAEVLDRTLPCPSGEVFCCSCRRTVVEGVRHLMGSKDKDSISTNYEVEINLHYTVHVIIQWNRSVTGKILKRLISNAVDEEKSRY